MEKIVWSPAFCVGISTLDAQHKQIVGMINQLVDATEVTVQSEVISEILARLTRYASEHFQAEERLLEAHGYPKLSLQKADHKEYRLKIVALCQDAMLHEKGVPTALLQFLHKWWTEHILQSDMQYRTFLLERGVK